MKQTKQILVFAICLALLFCVFPGCSNDWAADFDDDEKIASSSSSASTAGSSIMTINNSSTIKYSSFNGKKDMWSVNSNGAGAITLEYDLQINGGRFKCVLVSPDKDVTVLFHETSSDTKSIDVPEGKSIIKFVGDGAGIELRIKITEGGDSIVRMLDLDRDKKGSTSLMGD